ncbi:hypothetical protein PFISCL1PPCAC_26089, partial [Pristionchus fissidentatus]
QERIREDAANNRFIELIEWDNHLYGLTIGGVQQDRHCILDVVYDKAIRCLKSANINPIVILIKPSGPAQIMQWSPREISEEEAQIEFNRVERDEKMFEDLTTHIISEAQSFDDIFQQVLDIVFGRQ